MLKKEKSHFDPEAIAPAQFPEDPVLAEKAIEHDAVFGEITESGPNYRNVGWLGTMVLMMKTQMGLGILSLPMAFHSLGLIPGIIILLTIATITTWSDWMIGVFKLRHPHVYGIDDVGHMLFGRIGYEVFGATFCLFLIFVAGSAILSISIAFNALSTHAVCTAIFVVVAAIIGFIGCSIETLGRISWLAWVGAASIIVSVFIVTIGVGVQGHPPAQKDGIIPTSDYKLFNNPSFTEAISAVSTIVFAYCGTPAFFNIVSEMREPKKYSRALFLSQGIVTTVYIIIGVVIYYYCGSYVASPALGSAGRLLEKVAYGIALPGLIASMVIYLHLSAKHVFIRFLRGTEHLSTHTPLHWIAWFACTFGATVVAYVIASGIPVFSSLVSLIGALLGTFLCFQPMGCMWLYDNWKVGQGQRSVKWKMALGWALFVIISGTFLMIAGTYGSIVAIIDSYNEDGGSGAWSCADNSGSS